jgi:hypothetical protein
MILTDNEDAAITLRRMAFDGRDYMLGANEDEDIILGYHMNMTPEDAVKGLLLFNGMNESSYGIGGDSMNYRDLTKMECFNGYT